LSCISIVKFETFVTLLKRWPYKLVYVKIIPDYNKKMAKLSYV